MKRLLTLFSVATLATCLATSAKAQLLIGGATKNGWLDNNVGIFDPAAAATLAYPTVWINNGFKTLSGPYNDDLSDEAFAGPAPTPVTAGAGAFDQCTGPDCGVFFKAFTGNIGTGDLANAVLYQDNPATAGKLYILNGWAGSDPNYSGLIAGPTQSLFRLQFLNAASTVIGNVPFDLAAAGLGVANGQPFNYKDYQFQATAPAGTVTVRASVEMLNGYSNPAGGGQAFVADDFTLTGVVPEPTSVTLCMLGLVGLFGLVRRR